MSWPDPKVVMADGPLPTVQCRDRAELAACEELLSILRRGNEPVAIVYRQRANGEIEVAARGAAFASVQDAIRVMTDATSKLTARLFNMRRLPARA